MRRILLFLLLICLLSCTSQPIVPPNILPVKEMQSVLWDMVRSDMMVNYQHARDTSLNRFTASIALYQQTFTLHHITKDDFKRSLSFYQTRPDLMQTILDSLYAKSSAASPAKPGQATALP